MTYRSVMEAVFDPKQHLATCFELPTREPEAYYRPGKTRRTPYFDECAVLVRHKGEVEKLRSGGVPFYLAEALVVVAYAHTEPTLEKRVKEASKR